MKALRWVTYVLAIGMICCLLAGQSLADDYWAPDPDDSTIIENQLSDTVHVDGTLRAGEFLDIGSNYFYPWLTVGVWAPCAVQALKNESDEELSSIVMLDNMIFLMAHEPGTDGHDDAKFSTHAAGVSIFDTIFLLKDYAMFGGTGGNIVSDNDMNLFAMDDLNAGHMSFGTGTITVVGTDVTGIGTLFTSELKIGDTILPVENYREVIVADIIDDTHLTIEEPLLDDITETIEFLFAHVVFTMNNGNVGIHTTSPQSELAVNGTITTRKLVVTDLGWADYVFDETYALPPLSTVESYIQTNRHLPDVPSGREIEENGLQVGEVMARQMQKIEELTLYIIELEKRIRTLESER